MMGKAAENERSNSEPRRIVLKAIIKRGAINAIGPRENMRRWIEATRSRCDDD